MKYEKQDLMISMFDQLYHYKCYCSEYYCYSEGYQEIQKAY